MLCSKTHVLRYQGILLPAIFSRPSSRAVPIVCLILSKTKFHSFLSRRAKNTKLSSSRYGLYSLYCSGPSFLSAVYLILKSCKALERSLTSFSILKSVNTCSRESGMISRKMLKYKRNIRYSKPKSTHFNTKS